MDTIKSEENVKEEELYSEDYLDETEFELDNMGNMMVSSSLHIDSPFGPAYALTRSVSLDESNLLYTNSNNIFKTPPNGVSGQLGPAGGSDSTKAQYSFPNKLYNMLEVSDDAVFGWLANGKGFRVHNVEKFTSQLLPKFFNHGKFESFQRQLNIYGFKRVLKGSLVGAYFNSSFQRGYPELLSNIKRTVASRSRSMGSMDGSQDATPSEFTAPGKRKRRSMTANTSLGHMEDEMQLWSASLDTGMDDMLSESNSMFPPFPFISKSSLPNSNLLNDSMDNTSLIAYGDSDFHKSSNQSKLSLSLPSGPSNKDTTTKALSSKKHKKVLSQLQKTIAMYGHLSSAFVSPREGMNDTINTPSAVYTPKGAVSSDSNSLLMEHDSPISLDCNANSVLCMADVASPDVESSPKSPRGRPPRIRKPKLFDDDTYSPYNGEILARGIHRPVPTVPRTPGGREVMIEDLTEISIDPFVLAQYGEIYYMPPEGGKAIRIKANYISDHSSRAPLRSVSSEHPSETPSSSKRSSPAKKSSSNSAVGKKSSSVHLDETLEQDSQRTDTDLLHNLALGAYDHDQSDMHSDIHMDLQGRSLATPFLSLLPNIGDMSHTHEIPFETIFG